MLSPVFRVISLSIAIVCLSSFIEMATTGDNITEFDIGEGVVEKMENFKCRNTKTNVALIFKFKDSTVVPDEELEDFDIEELVEKLPSSEPRYIVLSYVFKHKDGRISCSVWFIFLSPMGCKHEDHMKYAGGKVAFMKAMKVTKCFDLRSVEELTEEWLLSKLDLFQ